MNTTRRRFLAMAAGLPSLPAIAVAVAKPELKWRANSDGIRAQLDRCGRVADGAGSKLSFEDIERQLYALKRHRANRPVDHIEVLVQQESMPQVVAMFRKCAWWTPKHELPLAPEI